MITPIVNFSQNPTWLTISLILFGCSFPFILSRFIVKRSKWSCEGDPSIQIYLSLILQYNRLALPYPPGPKGKPIIGNLFDMPVKEQWIKATEWAETYGKYNGLALHLNSFLPA
jgi:hypothetical protein